LLLSPLYVDNPFQNTCVDESSLTALPLGV
jgi:hypothetical protein